MALIKAKQIEKLLASYIPLEVELGFPAIAEYEFTGTPSALETACATAGDKGKAVPFQSSAVVGDFDQVGFPIAAPHNRVELWSKKTGKKPTSISGKEIYGRLEWDAIGSIFKVVFYTLGLNDAEDPYEFPAIPVNGGRVFKMEIPYLFTFALFPRFGIISIFTRNVHQDSGGSGEGVLITERIVPTADDTFDSPTLTQAPSQTGNAKMTVNGVVLYAPLHFTMGGTDNRDITISEVQSAEIQYPLDDGDTIFMEYFKAFISE